MTTPGTNDEAGLFDLAPEEPAKPVQRWVAPSQAAANAKPLPCPKCRYDLRGLRSDVCPECGLNLTHRARRDAQNLRDGINPRAWFDRKAFIMAVLGLATSAAVWGTVDGVDGLIVFGIDFAFSVVVGWLVFIACSMLWIGFDQPLRTTLVQTIGAYGGFVGVWALLSLLPVPMLVLSVIGFLILLGMLADALDIEYQDAGIIAIIVSALRFGFWVTVVLTLD